MIGISSLLLVIFCLILLVLFYTGVTIEDDVDYKDECGILLVFSTLMLAYITTSFMIWMRNDSDTNRYKLVK